MRLPSAATIVDVCESAGVVSVEGMVPRAPVVASTNVAPSTTGEASTTTLSAPASTETRRKRTRRKSACRVVVRSRTYQPPSLKTLPDGTNRPTMARIPGKRLGTQGSMTPRDVPQGLVEGGDGAVDVGLVEHHRGLDLDDVVVRAVS